MYSFTNFLFFSKSGPPNFDRDIKKRTHHTYSPPSPVICGSKNYQVI